MTRPAVERRCVALCLALGATLGWRLGSEVVAMPPVPPWPVVAGLIAAAVAAWAFPQARRVGRGTVAGLYRVRRLGRAGLARLSVGCALVAVALLWWAALQHGRPAFPTVHDECSYALQARMLAGTGRVWADPLPPQIAASFDSFHILVAPAYGSIYFAGNALFQVWTALLELPIWVVPGLIGAATVGVLCWTLGRLLDPLCGLIGAMLLAGNREFQVASSGNMASGPALLLGLASAALYLRWRESMRSRERAWPWAIAAGAAAGWAAIVRPPDAVAAALPVLLAVALDLARSRPTGKTWRGPAATVLAALAGAAPFLAWQASANRALTGDLAEPPYVRYITDNHPGTGFGLTAAGPLAPTPDTPLAQKRAYYDGFVAGYLEQHRPSQVVSGWLDVYLPQALAALLGETWALPWAVALVPVGVLAARRRRRWVVAGLLPPGATLYVLYTFFFPHYVVFASAATLVLVLGGWTQLARRPPVPVRWRRAARRGLWMAGGVLLATAAASAFLASVASGPPIAGLWQQGQATEAALAEADIRAPALVLFEWSPDAGFHYEPVYNLDAARVEDNPVVRAHDLGREANLALLGHFAQTQPQRRVWHFDRGTLVATPLGPAGEAYRRLRDAGR